LTVATTWKYRAFAPDGIDRPFALKACGVVPLWAGVEFPSRPGMEPQRTWVSVTGSPAGPWIDQVIPNNEPREVLDGAFTEMNGWLRASTAFQTFTTPQP